MLDHPFKDKVVILTGGSQGIGEQMAYQLADQGAWLALAARYVDKAERRGDNSEVNTYGICSAFATLTTSIGHPIS